MHFVRATVVLTYCIEVGKRKSRTSTLMYQMVSRNYTNGTVTHTPVTLESDCLAEYIVLT